MDTVKAYNRCAEEKAKLIDLINAHNARIAQGQAEAEKGWFSRLWDGLF